MSNEKIARILYVLLFLLVANLGATAFLVFTRHAPGGLQTTSTGTGDQIDKNHAQQMAKKIVSLYNEQNYSALYSEFDDLAKMQLTQNHLVEIGNKLHSVVGKVDDFAYSHSEMSGKQNGKEYFVMHYKVRLSGGPLSAGEMKITVAKEGDRLALFGFFLNALQQ